MNGFDVVDISDWLVISQEPGGDDDKTWVARPEHAVDGFRSEWWIFKPVKRGATSTYRRYDDQSERAASALASLIGLPAAKVELARQGSIEGIISRNVVPEGWEEQSGDLILSELPGYLSCSVTPRPKNRIGHNLPNIRSVMQDVSGPSDNAQPGPRSMFSSASCSSMPGSPTPTVTRATGRSLRAVTPNDSPQVLIMALRWHRGLRTRPWPVEIPCGSLVGASRGASRTVVPSPWSTLPLTRNGAGGLWPIAGSTRWQASTRARSIGFSRPCRDCQSHDVPS